MNVNQVQLFTNGYAVRCETFSCGEPGMYFIGRPDAPFNTNYVLCPKCAEELTQSITSQLDIFPGITTPGTVVITEELYEDLKTSAAAWIEHSKDLTPLNETTEDQVSIVTIVSSEKGSSTVESGANGFRIQTDGELNLTGNVDLVSQDRKVDFSNGTHIFIVGESGEEPPQLKMPKPKDFDLDEALKDARSHKELDEIVSHLSLTNVPPKEDADGNKATMEQRKEAILSNFQGDEE